MTQYETKSIVCYWGEVQRGETNRRGWTMSHRKTQRTQSCCFLFCFSLIMNPASQAGDAEKQNDTSLRLL
jgi:hypothetical protein